MKKRMIIVTAMIMGTLGAECVSVQASDTLPELTKDNALEQMMKAGETDSLVSNHKSYEATCEYILQNTKVYDYEDSEVMYVDMYGTTQMLYKDGELKYGKDPEMRKLAENIINAQKAEIEQMQKWLKVHNKK